jgi:hypothetical protein
MISKMVFHKKKRLRHINNSEILKYLIKTQKRQGWHLDLLLVKKMKNSNKDFWQYWLLESLFPL